MSTYLYEYRRHSKGEILGKYNGGYIYDLTRHRTESSGQIIAKAQSGYLHKALRASYECTDYYVEGNVLYKRSGMTKEPLYIAKNNLIYSYANYTLRTIEVAQYEGIAHEALFIFAALKYIEGISISSSSTRNASSSSNSTSKNQASKSSGNGGDGCAGIFSAIGLFGFAAVIILLLEYYEYYPLIYIIFPALILGGILIARWLSEEKYQYKLSHVLLGGLAGAGAGLGIMFISAFVDMIVTRYFAMDRGFVISLNTASTICYIQIIIIGMLLSAEEKK